jgi:hypothetical protein
MRRRVGVMLGVLAATLLIATESAWACRFLDGLFSRCRVRRCCVCYCWVPCRTVAPVCPRPTVCGPVVEAPKEALKEAPKEAPPEAPKEAPPVEEPAPPPVEQPAPPPVEEPAPPPVEEPAPPPVEEPAPPPVEQPAPPPVEQPVPPVEQPAEPPVEQPAPPPVEQPAEPTADEDPFASHGPGGWHLWTDISGKYHVEARFVSFHDGTVRLKKSNGRYCRIDFDKLSLADQDFVRRQIEWIATSW